MQTVHLLTCCPSLVFSVHHIRCRIWKYSKQNNNKLQLSFRSIGRFLFLLYILLVDLLFLLFVFRFIFLFIACLLNWLCCRYLFWIFLFRKKLVFYRSNELSLHVYAISILVCFPFDEHIHLYLSSHIYTPLRIALYSKHT